MSLKTNLSTLASIYIEESNNQLFQLALDTITKKTKNDKKTIVEKKELKNQLQKNEFKIKIDVMIKTFMFKMILNVEDDDDTDEIFLEIKSHHVRFVRLSFEKIMKIFNEKFKLINLYKLRHMKDFSHEFFKNHDRIEIENDQLKNLKKTIDIFKDFEKTFYEIYSKIFINY